MKTGIATAALLLTGLLAACSGGGGTSGGGGGGGIIPTPPTGAPTSTPTPPTTYAASGTLHTFGAGTPLSGATVTIGTLPSRSTCVQTAGCAYPLAPTLTATTAADGSFSIPGLANGSYFLTISNGSGYAILHRSITVASGALALGTVNLTALTADQQAWLTMLNSDRATVANPATTPIIVDEYATEQAMAEATAVGNGTVPYSDPTEQVYATNYGAMPGAMYGAGGVMDANVGPGNYTVAENAMFTNEKANCPSGNWQTCTFAANTGHYINLAQDALIWIGLGESTTPALAGSGVTGFYIYSGVPVYAGTSTRTGSSTHIVPVNF